MAIKSERTPSASRTAFIAVLRLCWPDVRISHKTKHEIRMTKNTETGTTTGQFEPIPKPPIPKRVYVCAELPVQKSAGLSPTIDGSALSAFS